jgi:CBS domain-containing protein
MTGMMTNGTTKQEHMIAKEIATYDILPLNSTDTCSYALKAMDENNVSHLPVVNERELLGLVTEFDLVNHPDLNDAVGNVKLSLPNAFISAYQHVFDVMKMMAEMRLSLLPVVEQKNLYSGVITLPNLLNYLTVNMSVLKPGGIIVLEMAENDYSLTEIVRIVETNDAKVIGVFLTNRPDSTMLEIALKVDVTDLSALIQAFERYNYAIKATFAEKDDLDELKERYDALMNYLNV